MSSGGYLKKSLPRGETKFLLLGRTDFINGLRLPWNFGGQVGGGYPLEFTPHNPEGLCAGLPLPRSELRSITEVAKKRKRKACPVVNAKRYTSGDDFKFF